MKISIITATYNSAAYLEQTIRSVLAQSYAGIEYIIIDGASSDGTIEIIERYRHRLAYYTSEPDRNMYDAINKGLAKATGDFILNLNSDDVLADNTCIARAVEYMQGAGADAYVADIITEYPGGWVKKRRHKPVRFKELLLSRHSTFLPHLALFVSRGLNARLQGYDLAYHYAADFDYILRMLQLDSVRIRRVPVLVTRFRFHAGSITASGKLEKERLDILRKFGYDDFPRWRRRLQWLSGWLGYLARNADNYYAYFLQKMTTRTAR